MGTKNDPGKFDCYANAEPDEPMFVLLARDISAKYLTAAWAAIKCGDMVTAMKMVCDAIKEQERIGKPFREPLDPTILEANQCSRMMQSWAEMRQLEAIQKRLEGT